MSLTLTFETQAFSREIQQLRVLLKKTGAQIIKSESKLFTRDAMKMTPPCGRHAVTESWNAQRKLGMASVRRDITRLFPPLGGIAAITGHPRAAEFFKRYVKARNKEAVRTMLADFGITGLAIYDEATKELHNSARDSRGRVRSKTRFLVLDPRSTERLIKSEEAQVGKGKAGWMPAAQATGLSVPNWISRHSGSPGRWVDRTKDTLKPYVELGNLVSYVQDAGNRMSIVRAAMQNRTRSMRIRIEKGLKNWGK